MQLNNTQRKQQQRKQQQQQQQQLRADTADTDDTDNRHSFTQQRCPRCALERVEYSSAENPLLVCRERSCQYVYLRDFDRDPDLPMNDCDRFESNRTERQEKQERGKICAFRCQTCSALIGLNELVIEDCVFKESMLVICGECENLCVIESDGDGTGGITRESDGASAFNGAHEMQEVRAYGNTFGAGQRYPPPQRQQQFQQQQQAFDYYANAINVNNINNINDGNLHYNGDLGRGIYYGGIPQYLSPYGEYQQTYGGRQFF
jgi:Ni/Co efflux regulator RcnB